MEVIYGISRWSNPSRSAARHINNGFGGPLCGHWGKRVFSIEREEGEPTCQRCIQQANKTAWHLTKTILIKD